MTVRVAVWGVLAATGLWLLGCAHEQPRPPPPPPPRANVQGLTILVEDVAPVQTASDECRNAEASLMQALPDALRRASEKALTNAGFQVVTGEAQHVLVARIDANLAYCSGTAAHIATGETGITLLEGNRVIARGNTSGDLASPLDALMGKVVSQLVHSRPLIDYVNARGGAGT